MRSKATLGALLASVLTAGAAGAQAIPTQAAAPLTSAEQSLVGITQRVSPAVVGISTRQGAGSGFIIRADGIVLTNWHVVGNYRTVTVELARAGSEPAACSWKFVPESPSGLPEATSSRSEK